MLECERVVGGDMDRQGLAIAEGRKDKEGRTQENGTQEKEPVRPQSKCVYNTRKQAETRQEQKPKGKAQSARARKCAQNAARRQEPDRTETDRGKRLNTPPCSKMGTHARIEEHSTPPYWKEVFV